MKDNTTIVIAKNTILRISRINLFPMSFMFIDTNFGPIVSLLEAFIEQQNLFLWEKKSNCVSLLRLKTNKRYIMCLFYLY